MLARQLLIGVLAVVIPSTLLLGGVAVYSLTTLGRMNAELVQLMHSREAVADLHLMAIQVGAPLGAFVLGGDQRNRQRFEALLGVLEQKIQSCGTAACHSTAKTPARMVGIVTPVIEQIRTEGRLAFEEGPEAGRARVEEVRKAVGEMRGLVDPMLGAVRQRGNELVAESQAVGWRVWALSLSLTVALALAGCGMAIVVARRISRPVSALMGGTRRIMAGDWTVQVPTDSTGEIGELASSFNRMVQEVRQSREALEEHNRALEERVRQRTEELRQKEHALAQSEKLASLGLLAAGVAHELNNPLTSIMMNANLLKEEVGADSALARDLERIDADAGRCRRIIDDLRAFARLRRLDKVPGEVDTVVDQALSAASPELWRRHVRVDRDVDGDLPPIEWDADRMVQVLTNLLVNAAQAAGPGGGRIVVRARREGSWLRLEVQDDGPGIPVEARNRIFDPFFTTKPDGTGLGLSISHGIVDEHGGRIEVESRTVEEAGAAKRTGTTMRVLVPLSRAAP